MPKKAPERQSQEQKLWEIFLTRCILHNESYKEESSYFVKWANIEKVCNWAKEKGISNSYTREEIFHLCMKNDPEEDELFNSEHPFLGVKAGYDDLYEKWGIPPKLSETDWVNRESKLASGAIVKEFIKGSIQIEFIVGRPPIRQWTKGLRNTQYMKFGIDFSYPFHDLQTCLQEIQKQIGKYDSQGYLKKCTSMKKTLLSYLELSSASNMKMSAKEITYAVTSMNRLFEMYEHQKNVSMLRIARMYSSEQRLEFESAYKKVKGRITFVQNCVEDVMKLVSPRIS